MNDISIAVEEINHKYPELAFRNIVFDDCEFILKLKELCLKWYIEIIYGWDIDNKCIKPIADALTSSKVITDDNIDKMFYCVKGEFSNTPHTEIFVAESKNFKEIIENKMK